MKEALINFIQSCQRDGSDVFFIPLFIGSAIGMLCLFGWFILEMTRLIVGGC